MNEGWSSKYKKSIDCNNPKGFSQKAHCQGKKKKMNEEKDKRLVKIVKQLRKSVKNHAKQADYIEKVNEESNPRIPRKKGQPANSKKHSDLYTDENPKGTIHGLGFKDVATAKASVSKIRNSSRSHAHKIQAAVAMEQRAREMGKTSEAAIYRKFINSMKKKTKSMNESAVTELEDGMMKLSDLSYDSIDKLMIRIAKTNDITTTLLHNQFKTKHLQTPDDWAKSKKMNEENLTEISINKARKAEYAAGVRSKIMQLGNRTGTSRTNPE